MSCDHADSNEENPTGHMCHVHGADLFAAMFAASCVAQQSVHSGLICLGKNVIDSDRSIRMHIIK